VADVDRERRAGGWRMISARMASRSWARDFPVLVPSKKGIR